MDVLFNSDNNQAYMSECERNFEIVISYFKKT